MEAVNICEYYENGTRIPLSSSKHPLNDKIVHTNVKEIYGCNTSQPHGMRDTANIYECYDKDGTRLSSSSSKYQMIMSKYGGDVIN